MKLTRLLLKGNSIWQLSVAWIGWATGLAMLLSGMQFMRNFERAIATETDLIGPEYVTLQKKITLLNTFDSDRSAFGKDEIKALEGLSGVQQVAAFLPNRYSAHLYISKESGGAIPYFYTDVFFESLPTQVIDLDPMEWQWSPGQDEVPILLPKDFLHLYNYGFAPGQNLPQLSEGTIGMVDFGIRIRGNGKTGEYRGRVVGFSSRINSILVPLEFLESTNGVYGEQPDSPPKRLVVRLDNVASETFTDYITRKGYEASGAGLRTGKLHGLLTTVLQAVISIAALILILCFMNLLQTILLLVARSEYEIRTLLLIGYTPLRIMKVYLAGKVVFLLSSSLLAYVLSSGVNGVIQATMSAQGGEWVQGMDINVMVTGLILTASVLVIDYVVLRRTISRLVR